MKSKNTYRHHPYEALLWAHHCLSTDLVQSGTSSWKTNIVKQIVRITQMKGINPFYIRFPQDSDTETTKCYFSVSSPTMPMDPVYHNRNFKVSTSNQQLEQTWFLSLKTKNGVAYMDLNKHPLSQNTFNYSKIETHLKSDYELTGKCNIIKV